MQSCLQHMLACRTNIYGFEQFVWFGMLQVHCTDTGPKAQHGLANLHHIKPSGQSIFVHVSENANL